MPAAAQFGPAGIAALGRRSEGVRLCLAEGPASGRTVAYACRNRPAGRGAFGRWLDGRFLAFPGWEGVRQRHRHLQHLLRMALTEARAPAHLLDLAGGTSAALLQVWSGRADGATAVCIDLDRSALAEGATHAGELGVTGVQFDWGDAIDGLSLLARRPRPDVVACTGLYELLADDAAVRRSLAIVAELLPSGGRFVVAHQSSVPPLGRFGRGLTDAAGGRPPLTPRSAGTLTHWLAEAGFYVERVVDAGGLYTLLMARRT